MILNTPEYLGDGVYVQIDVNGSLLLTTGSHKLAEADSIIWLESSLIDNLMRYIAKLNPPSGGV